MLPTIGFLPLRTPRRRSTSAHPAALAHTIARHLGYLFGGILIAAIGWLFFALVFAL